MAKAVEPGRARGIVYLVGAGPGDPGLITRRGAELLARAQVVVYDYLASPSLLDLASPKAEMIYVGKKGGHHSLSQEGINRLLVDKAQTHRTVVRLKGGDPFVFGRGGEEAQALVEAGARVEVVPGVSSAVAVPAYAGIPITHRSFNSTVTLATGHEDPSREESRLDWEALARAQTLVMLMGVKRLEENIRALLDHGLPPDTPAALIQWGTTHRQRTVVAPVSGLAAKAREKGIEAPAVLVVGRVAELREKLAWLERRPLWGMKVMITRAAEGASRLAGMVAELGAEPVVFPTVAIVPPPDPGPLERAVERLSDFDWLVLTSANGVSYFFQALDRAGLDARALGGVKVCAIGPATAKALAQRHIKADRVPEEYRAEAVVELLAEEARAGRSFLLARAEEAREILPQGLTELGGRVEVVAAYRSEVPSGDKKEEVGRLLEKGLIDVVIFSASSTVNNLARIFPDQPLDRLLGRTKVAVIGPITAKTAQAHGLKVTVQPREYTLEALLESLVEWRTSQNIS
jgi:uroporphyrinogen III methyltransferase/synthase